MLIQLGQLIINQIYPYNIGLKRYCSEFSGKILHIKLTDISLDIAVYIHKDGLYLKPYTDESSDVCVTSTLSAVAPFILRNKSHLKMHVTGELVILESLQNLLKHKPLHLDLWLHDHLGLAAGTLVYESIKTLEKLASETANHITEDTQQYMQSEQSYLSVDEDLSPLKNDLQQLEYKLDRLEFKLNKILDAKND